MRSGNNGNGMRAGARKKAVKRRALTFKVLDEERKAVVAVPFETAASDTEIDNYVRDSIARINELRSILEAHPALMKLTRGRGVRYLTFYIHDSQTNLNHECYTLSEIIGPHMTKVETMIESARAQMVAHASRPEALKMIYQAMAAYLRKKKWNIEEIKSVQWREVCALHPFYLSGFWDETRKRKFEKVSKRSIKAGALEGRYKIPGVATEAVS